jgi:tetratricopeptide (TPR) repeat protein
MRVSLTMIVRNEEANLAACLACVIDLVDEVILVDTGSTDRTKEIARQFGDKVKVFDFPWVDDFAAARNEALRHATGEFVLWLDADDRIDDLNRGKLRQLLAGLQDDNAAYVFKCVCPPDASSNQPTAVDHVRLFRNRPDLRWRYPVHEQILGPARETGAEVRFTDVATLHVGYLDPVLRARKTERDLRILHRAHAQSPDDPFILFNLGMTYHDLGRHEQALEFLRLSLERSHPEDSITRKLFSLIAGCHLALGRREQALRVLEEGLQYCPDDAELLYRQAQYFKSAGNWERAEASLWRLLSTRPGLHFASTDPSLRGWRGRDELAVVLFQQQRYNEAQAQWRLVVREHPDCFPAWLGLADVAIQQRESGTLEEVARQLERLEGGTLQADLLRARMLLHRGDLAGARALARRQIEQHPRQVGPRVILARALVTEGGDRRVAEEAWRQVLVCDPCHEEAQRMLADLIRQRVRNNDGYFQALAEMNGWVLGERYHAACVAASELSEHLPVLHDLAEECKHITDVGTGRGLAALAFLWAQPDHLVCLDVVRTLEVEQLQALAGRTKFQFLKAEVLGAELEETDLLFLDTQHDAGQLRAELARHAGRARRYVVLHGTTRHAEQGETPGQPGLWPVIEEFLRQGIFRLRQRYQNSEGLTVLERVRPGTREEN